MKPIAVPSRGFSLIELMIGLSLAVILLLLAAPGYAVWIADAQIRNATESVSSGMRLAWAEAVKRNTPVEFILDGTTGTGGWRVNVVGVGDLQEAVFAEGSARASFARTPAAATTVTFSGLGTVIANADASAILTAVAVTESGGMTGTRPLTVLVGGGRTGIKICDPDPGVLSTDARYCTS